MRRTAWLQETRMQRFEEALDAWTEKRLTQEEAALLGVCARTFRRYVDRHEESGIDGLVDRRLPEVSARRAPVDEVLRLEALYRESRQGWSVAHFHDRYRERHAGERSYTWARNRVQEAGLAAKGKRRGTPRRRRERAPIPGLLVHQDGSSHEWVPGSAWGLIATMDDATSEVYSGFFVEEEGTLVELARRARDARAAGAVLQPVHGPGIALLAHAGGGRQGGQGQPDAVRAGHGGAGDRDDPVVLAGGAGPLRALLRDGAGPASAGAGAGGHHRHGGGEPVPRRVVPAADEPALRRGPRAARSWRWATSVWTTSCA